MVPNKTLDEWLMRIGNGDVHALEELYCETKDAIYAYSLSVVRNKTLAEDVLQDTYVSIYENAGRYEGRNKPLAWMFTIAKNNALSRLRKNRDNAVLEDLSEVLGVSNDDAENRLFLSYLFKHVSNEDRDICLLHAVAGFKHREIAQMLGLPLGTVLARYRRTMNKLRKLAEEA